MLDLITGTLNFFLLMNKTPGYISSWKYQGETNFAYYSNKQLKLSGSVLEYKVYGKHFSLDQKHTFSSLKNDELSSTLSTELSTPVEDIRNKVLFRARTKIRDYVNCNVNAYKSSSGRSYRAVFVTLTFRDNLTSLDITNSYFTSFIQSFSLYYFGSFSKLRYLAVPEFQGRGAVHYHCIFFNLPYRHDVKTILSNLWVHGFSQIKGITRVRNVGRYISKYLSKDFVNLGVRGKKSYFVSRGLFKPLITNYDEIISRVLSLVPDSSLEYEKMNIELPYLVSMDYQSYNLEGHDSILEQSRSYFEV